MKKVGILTQHLHNNYGGLLQAFALQFYLNKNGFNALTVDFSTEKKNNLSTYKQVLKNVIKKYIFQKKIKSVFPNSKDEKRRIAVHTNRFKQENIRLTHHIGDLSQLSELEYYQFDAFIVGSDQVWRPEYSPGMPAFFLNFVKDDNKTKRLSYAASFGVDHCDEYTKAELAEFSRLAKKFDGISVREESAVKLCQSHFGVSAKHVIDPTMLLNAEDYIELVHRDCVPKKEGILMAYVLDKSPDKKMMIDKVASQLSLELYSVMPKEKGDVYPPVTTWIRGFMDAEFVITDSFHGTVFSILFNKPFISVGNVSRGVARFTSLLKMFGLESRLVCSLEELSEQIINEKIDYEKVNQLLNDKRDFSSKFLLGSLN